MEIQSVLIPQENICDVEELYFHRDGDWVLFNGYFNLFYLEKHHKYCDIEKLSLELEIKGVKRVVLMHDDAEIIVHDFAGCNERQRVSVTLPYFEYEKGVFWFKALLDESCVKRDSGGIEQSWLIRGYFDGKTKENALVELGINICTFRREKYVFRNMKALIEWAEDRKGIDGKGHAAAEHMHVFIIDNGQTLSKDETFMSLIQKAEIDVIPNANTGGTGGFSRGMVEAMNRKDELGLTHLLMMDDDAVFDPDLFVRLYGFLSMLRPEYREITVGGALLREDYQYIQHAAGEWFTDFKVINEHPLVDLRNYDNCTADWMCGTDKEHRSYGAWWCCCYNMNAITKENLPLPIFVHHDDIQFGMKQTKRGIVFLNGIGVWHQGFELVFPGVKQYYNMRNTLITMKMFEPDNLSRKMHKWAARRYIGMLVSYRYADCEFVYRGYKDFKKGKKWLLASSPEDIHKELSNTNRRLCGMKPIAELELSEAEKQLVYEQIYEKTGIDFGKPGLEKEEKKQIKILPDQLREYYTSTRFQTDFLKKLTFNGWFLPAKKGIKVITPLDSPWDVYRYKKILLYEPATEKGAVMNRSNFEFFKGVLRIIYLLV